MESVAHRALETLHRFKEALQFLERERPPSVLFMPDIVRDGILIVPDGRDLVSDLSPENEKNRIRGYPLFMKGGGHAFIAGYAAAVLREQMNVGVHLAARIYDGDEHDLVQGYMVHNPLLMGASPIDTSFISILPGERSPFNLVIEQKGGTRILTGEQPVLRLSELGVAERHKLLDALRTADLVAALSLKAPSLREIIQEIIVGNLTIKELFSDCTSGDRVGDNYGILDTLRIQTPGMRSPITLLSINSNEARLYAALLALEREGLRENMSDSRSAEGLKDLDEIIDGKSPKDSIEAAALLNEALGIPLLFHSSDGSCIFDKRGERQTLFVPSVSLRILPDNFVGAGDTLCGGMALALVVKQRLENPHINAPNNFHLSYEDCLLIANLVTCYRLETVGILSSENRHHEWHTAVGTISRIMEWAKDAKLKPVSVIIPYTLIPPHGSKRLSALGPHGAAIIGINGFGRIGRLMLRATGLEGKTILRESVEAYFADHEQYIPDSPSNLFSHFFPSPTLSNPRVRVYTGYDPFASPSRTSGLGAVSKEAIDAAFNFGIRRTSDPKKEQGEFSVPTLLEETIRDTKVSGIIDDVVRKQEAGTTLDRDMQIACSMLTTFNGVINAGSDLKKERPKRKTFGSDLFRESKKHSPPIAKRIWRRRY